VLVWVYVYFHVQKRRRRRPHFYDISVLALYLLITVITILSTASFYQESISITTLEIASNYFRPRPDSHYIFFLNMEFVQEVFITIANSVADSILLCRCYYLWGSRKSVIFGPAVLCALNIVVATVGVIYDKKANTLIVLQSSLLAGNSLPVFSLSLASLACTFLTDCILTILIAIRLRWLSRIADCYPDGKRVGSGKKVHRLIAIIQARVCLNISHIDHHCFCSWVEIPHIP